MERAISCEFNLDTACVELKFADSSMILIDTVAVENEVADNYLCRPFRCSLMRIVSSRAPTIFSM